MLDFLAKISTRSVKLVNSQQRIDLTTREILIPRSVRMTLLEIARLASTGGLSAGGLGEVSARLTGDRFALNILDIPLSSITQTDFTIAALKEEKNISAIPPSRHAAWHRLVYAGTPAKYILFCQPVYAMVMAEKKMLPEGRFMHDAQQAVGGLALSTGDDAEIASRVVEHHSRLIQGYGLLVWGENPAQMTPCAEIVNRWCEISLSGTK